MAIEFIGKVSPEEVEDGVKDGFKKLELYTTEKHMNEETIKKLKDAKKKFGVEFYSIHTPHSEEHRFFNSLDMTKSIADEVGIKIIVVHSAMVDVFSKKVLDYIKNDPRMLPENGKMVNWIVHDLAYLERIFSSGLKICFDIAHFYASCRESKKDFYKDLETLMKEHASSIGHLHLCDTDEIDEDVAISDGEIDFYEAMKPISKYYNGVAVIEVKREGQAKSLRTLNTIMDRLSQ